MVGSPGWLDGPLPPVTPLTLSSPAKATLLWIILWRCSNIAGHGIARPPMPVWDIAPLLWLGRRHASRVRITAALILGSALMTLRVQASTVLGGDRPRSGRRPAPRCAA